MTVIDGLVTEDVELGPVLSYSPAVDRVGSNNRNADYLTTITGVIVTPAA